MPWLAKSDVTVPDTYGAVIPFIHWAADDKVVLIWAVVDGFVEVGSLRDNLYAWPIDVDPVTGELGDRDIADIMQIGTLSGDNQTIDSVESLVGGGYAIHTSIGGEG